MLKDIAWFASGVLHAIRDGKGTTCQHVMGPLRWLDRSPESFTPGCVDSPATKLPDFGARAIRWSLPLLYEAADTERVTRGLSWHEAADALAWPVESLEARSPQVRDPDGHGDAADAVDRTSGRVVPLRGGAPQDVHAAPRETSHELRM